MSVLKCLMVFVICIFTLVCCCGVSRASDVGAPEDIIRLSVSYSQMRTARSFELQEEKGEVLFSCCFITTDNEEIVLDKVRVASEYMQRLREMAKRHGFTQMKEKNIKNKPFVHDAPMYNMTMYWPDKKSLRLNYWPARDEVEKFFWDLADDCVSVPGAPEDISSLYYTYAHVNQSERFNFNLRSEDGNFLFSARYYTKNGEKVTLQRVQVDYKYIQRLREIVKEHNIVNMQRKHLYSGRSAPPSPYTILDIYWPDMRVLRLGEPTSGKKELELFFKDLAVKHSDQWKPTNVPELLEDLAFICNRTDEAGGFLFNLREAQASTLFSARFFTKDGVRIEFTGEQVEAKYMNQLREIVKKHDIVPMMKKKGSKENDDDLPYVLVIRWRDDPMLRTTGWPVGGEELEKFFRDLALVVWHKY